MRVRCWLPGPGDMVHFGGDDAFLAFVRYSPLLFVFAGLLVVLWPYALQPYAFTLCSLTLSQRRNFARAGLYAVDVPPEVDYARVAGILEEGEQDGRWDYEESSIEAVATEPVTAREPQRHSPLPPSQLEFLSRKRAEYLEVQPALGALEERLLALGGVAVVFRTEPDVEALVAHGRVFDQPVECFAGDPGNCHVNVARLWSGSTYPDAAIATGWALTDDDQLWRQHSWLVEPERLIETTVTRDKYFGIVLSPAAARAFSHAVGAT